MPSCFELIRKSDPDAGPVRLHQIDAEICAFAHVEVNPTYWAFNWYNTIGFALATGRSWSEIETDIYESLAAAATEPMFSYAAGRLAVAKFLQANFDYRHYYSSQK